MATFAKPSDLPPLKDAEIVAAEQKPNYKTNGQGTEDQPFTPQHSLDSGPPMMPTPRPDAIPKGEPLSWQGYTKHVLDASFGASPLSSPARTTFISSPRAPPLNLWSGSPD